MVQKMVLKTAINLHGNVLVIQMENISIDFIGINVYDKSPKQIIFYIDLEETRLYERDFSVPRHAANLIENSDNTAYGVESL